MVIKNAKQTGVLVVKNKSTLTMDSVELTVAEVTTFNGICVIRLYKEDTHAVLRNCKVSYTDGYWTSNAGAFIMFDYDFADRTVIIENTTIDATGAKADCAPISIVGADENSNNYVEIINSKLTPSAGAPLFLNLNIDNVTADELLLSKTTDGNVDTYTVILPNGLGSYTFTVTNGVDGQPGAQGPEGPQGPAGANGQTGATGPQGPEGPQGPAGAAGTNGTDGKDGVDGKDGADGADGATGPQGPAGADGKDGEDAASGLATVAIAVAAIAIVCNIVLAVAVVKKKKD